MEPLRQPGFAADITLEHIWVQYQRYRELKPVTQADYRKRLHRCFDGWLDRPVQSISCDDIEHKHQELTVERGPAEANIAMRYLRALLTFAAVKYPGCLESNPVKRLSQLRAWNRVKRRRGVILPHQMEAWWRSVSALQYDSLRDYLHFLVLTGFRRNEALTLVWDWVDLDDATINLPDSKNGEPHCLPLSDFLLDMLQRRRRRDGGLYVFGGKQPGTRLHNIRFGHHQVMRHSGVSFQLHDLRRTFVSVADSLELPDRTIKKLVNHKTNDVTEGYIIRSVERLRKPMQLITDEVLRQAKLK